MTKEELLELLKENLTISISTEHYSGYYNDNYCEVKIAVSFDDEIICTSSDTFRT